MDPIDIWRSAKLMIDKHADLAVIECAIMGDSMADRGDVQGEAIWKLIRRAVKSLQENGPPIDTLDPTIPFN
jgi:hypothetical protein